MVGFSEKDLLSQNYSDQFTNIRKCNLKNNEEKRNRVKFYFLLSQDFKIYS
jgi:hypothetical protein